MPSLGYARGKREETTFLGRVFGEEVLPEKVGMTNGAVACENWSPRLVLKMTSIISVPFMICIVPSPQTSCGSTEEAERKLDGAWISQFVLGMCWEQSRRERIHNYTLLLFNEGRVHLVNFPG